ncbi:MAG: hypothetical protein JXR65_01600, partial [Bacteroidales bacterium]|nr:hypothetical protein [Bacteroidales bacterium]
IPSGLLNLYFSDINECFECCVARVKEIVFKHAQHARVSNGVMRHAQYARASIFEFHVVCVKEIV